ncbi:MAG: hypothetical protein U0984_02425 [Prosthecobacter sp.]|nr:hypothetical protein [Prosthecobacter sp.]
MSDSPDLFAATTPPPEANPPAKAEEGTPKASARASLLKDKADAAEVPPKAAPPPRAAARKAEAAKAANASQSRVSRGLFLGAFGLLAVMMLGTIGMGVWIYQKQTALELAARAPVPATPPPVIDTSAMEASLERSNAKILELQKQLDAQREERDRTQGRLQEMADRMALVIQQSSFMPKTDAPRQTDASSGQMAALMPSVSPSTSELILLKERNRLSGYADTAIATGSREALQRIVDSLMDPAMKDLFHAAQAEFKRVQAYYEISVSIDPGYTLPVQELFKDSAARAEADLSPAQLQGVLRDSKQPWEARLRCAYLLRASTAPGTDEALLKAIKEDPSLDVAKQAQTSFEKRVARRFRLFDIPSIEAWWQSQGTGKATVVPMKEPSK